MSAPDPSWIVRNYPNVSVATVLVPMKAHAIVICDCDCTHHRRDNNRALCGAEITDGIDCAFHCREFGCEPFLPNAEIPAGAGERTDARSR